MSTGRPRLGRYPASVLFTSRLLARLYRARYTGVSTRGPFVAGCGDGGTTGPPANRAPTAVGTIPGRTLHVGESATVDVSARFTDPDGDALAFGASSSNPSVAAVSVSGSTVTVSARTPPTRRRQAGDRPADRCPGRQRGLRLRPTRRAARRDGPLLPARSRSDRPRHAARRGAPSAGAPGLQGTAVSHGRSARHTAIRQVQARRAPNGRPCPPA